MIILTSFKESLKLLKHSGLSNANTYSVSRFQPAGFHYTSLPFLAAVDVNGDKLHLRGREGDPIQGYKHDLFLRYRDVWDDIWEWSKTLDNNDIDMLCCWCPYASHSRKQLEINNTFVCHTGLIGLVINSMRPDIDVYLDNDHATKMVKEYRPKTWKALMI